MNINKEGVRSLYSKIEIDTSQVDVAIEKLGRLKGLLEDVQHLIYSMQNENRKIWYSEDDPSPAEILGIKE